ncbi:site-specific integrase [Desulfovibrio subterraneus]|uniref:tyrosine-type recombinase/integrase n=1 Tax=Desulfovibrio subterraneus TaxID=2718620 RepID=UPI0022B89189|nr:site-specific integrase [Desulfovibrio subterraneus]WBF68514.1 site-specific integrase [Desulfovibrio subterraneus]
MADRKRVKSYPGVYQRESERRKLNGHPDVCYEYIVTNPATNENKRVKVGWKSEGITAKIASEMRAEAIQKLRHGEMLVGSKRSEVTFGEAFAIYYEEHAKLHKKTHIDDLSIYNTHLKGRFGRSLLSQIGKSDLEEIKRKFKWPTDDVDERETIQEEYELKKKPLPYRSNSTINHIIRCVSRIYNKMIEWPSKSGYHGTNPTKGVKLLEEPRSRQRFLTKNEAQTLLDALRERSLQLYQMAYLSLLTGLRRSELFNLQWHDVDLDSGYLNLRNAKGGKDQKVHMPSKAVELLRDLSHERRGLYVFVTAKGERVSEISNTYERVVEEIGLNQGGREAADRVVWHTLRHTYASWLAQSGKVTLAQLKSAMRHKDIKTTLRYVHLLPDADGKMVAAVMDEML